MTTICPPQLCQARVIYCIGIDLISPHKTRGELLYVCTHAQACRPMKTRPFPHADCVLPSASRPPAPSVIHEPSGWPSAVSDVCQIEPHLSPQHHQTTHPTPLVRLLIVSSSASSPLLNPSMVSRGDWLVRHILNNLFDLMSTSLFKIMASGSSMLHSQEKVCLCVLSFVCSALCVCLVGVCAPSSGDRVEDETEILVTFSIPTAVLKLHPSKTTPSGSEIRQHQGGKCEGRKVTYPRNKNKFAESRSKRGKVAPFNMILSVTDKYGCYKRSSVAF